jgi:hypothetical protein
MQLRDAGVPFSPPSFDYGADALELLRQLDREASCKGARTFSGVGFRPYSPFPAISFLNASL